jgi:NarL family two-component system sensor histidine kinase LiaS
MRNSLQRRLTLSHLAVTAVSVTILVILILTGYFVYLRSDLAAAWAGDIAQNYAYDLAYWVEDEGGVLDEFLAQTYLETAAYDMGVVFADNIDDAEWIVVTTPDGRILASNFIDPLPDPLPGFNPAADPGELHYDTISGGSVGQAAVLSEDGTLFGWVYYRFPDDSTFLFKDTARNVILAAVGAALIAIVVSGVMGSWLARYFARRLNALTEASAAFAAGDLERRVSLAGDDEFARLGTQFNQMAAQIGRQMAELRLLAEQNAQLAEEARALAALEERNRLARELHDAIKQQLFGLTLTAGSAQKLIEKDPAQAAARLAQITGMVQQIQEEMDGIIQQLRPSSLGDNGLAAGLRALCAEWQRRHGIPVTLTVHEARPLPLNVEHGLYRVAQESLHNVARHARAAQVEVRLEYGETAVRLQIIDDGVGFQPGSPAGGSFGLISMKHRVAELGGEIEITSEAGRGTAVGVWLPL